MANPSSSITSGQFIMSESSNASSISSSKYGIPSEIRPVSISEDSEDESFVVLGKSLIPDSDDSPSSEIDQPVCTAVFNEAKQLINKELQEIEKLSLQNRNKKADAGDYVHDGVPSLGTSEKPPEKTIQSMTNSRLLKQMQSSELPQMPQVNHGFDTTNTISVTTITNDLNSEEVQNKISQIIEENIHLKDTILQNNMSMKSQYERIVVWQEEVQKVHQAHKEKIFEAKEVIEKQKEEISNLTSETDRLKQIIDVQNQELITVRNIMKEKEKQVDQKLVQSSDDNLKAFELDVANKKVRDLEKSLQDLTLENSVLKNANERLIVNSVESDKQKEKLQTALEQLQQAKKELEIVKTSAAENEKSLKDVIADLHAQLTKQKTDFPSPEELVNIKTQLTNTQIILTQVEQTRANAYSQMNKQSQEIERLNKQIEEMQAQEVRMKDERIALEIQLDVYKTDFEAERTAREMMKDEKDKIADDLQNLQRRNQHLQEEIDIIRENQGYHVYPRTTPRPTQSAPQATMKCPKCNFGFSSLQSLERHVHRCIELDDHLP